MMAAATRKDFNPRELGPQEIEQRRSRIGKDVLPDDVQDQEIEQSRTRLKAPPLLRGA